MTLRLARLAHSCYCRQIGSRLAVAVVVAAVAVVAVVVAAPRLRVVLPADVVVSASFQPSASWRQLGYS